MISEDDSVHLRAIGLAILIMLVAAMLGIDVGTGVTSAVVFLAFYGTLFGGAHLYLAIRGADGMVPPDARWRYVATLAVVVGSGALWIAVGPLAVGPVALATILHTVVAITVVAYLATETIDAYRDARPE